MSLPNEDKKDADLFIAVFNEFNIPFTIDKTGDTNDLIIFAKASDTVKGYTGFFTEFTFDKNWKFTHMGIWE